MNSTRFKAGDVVELVNVEGLPELRYWEKVGIKGTVTEISDDKYPVLVKFSDAEDGELWYPEHALRLLTKEDSTDRGDCIDE